MKKIFLLSILLAVPALAADDAAKANKPLPQDAQIKLLKSQRQFQQVQMQMTNLQRQYDQAVKDAKDLQSQMAGDCAAAAKEANVDLSKFITLEWLWGGKPRGNFLSKRAQSRTPQGSHVGYQT